MKKNLAAGILFALTIMLCTAFNARVSAHTTIDDLIFGNTNNGIMNILAPQASGVVINEIYGGGGNAGAVRNQDFVELYNNSSANVDISGYSLQYASAATATATAFTVCTITAADTVIEPGTYFLIATGPASTTVGTALPAADATCSSNLAAEAGKVALASGTGRLDATTCPPTAPAGTTIVDFVGYGATASCFETAPAPGAPDNATSVQRFPNGSDTENNSIDFQTTAPTPKAANIAAASGTIQFSSATYAVTEGTATVTITATRTGGSDGAVTADYATTDGSAVGGTDCATAGVDYITKTGTVSFTNGNTTNKTFPVAICDDTAVENAETVNITLSNPTGGATLGTPNPAVLTITDNDTAATTAPTFTSANSTTFTQGTAGSFQVTASGNPAPTFTVTNGTLPNGVTLSSAGLLSGTPTQSGTFTPTITATNGTAPDATQTFTLTVNAATIAVNPATLPNGTVGTAYSQTITATGGTSPYMFAVTAGTLPTGLALTPGGALSGTPTAAGTFNFTVTATDANGATGSRAYAVTINAANTAPTITANPTAQTISAGGTGTSTITITDEDAAGVVLTGASSNTTLVPNANIVFTGTGASRTLTVTPAAGQTGTAAITVTATDAGGLTGTTTYTLTVSAAANPTVSLSVSSNTAAESTPAGTPITVTATASSPVTTAQTVTVGVSGAGITGGDFTLSGTTITIPAGATSGSVTFAVNDDNISEGTETATLTISNPSSGITLGTPTSQSITITDNETSNTTTVVSPANMNGFVFFPEGPAGSFSTGTFVRGPGQPPLGMGTARFTVDNTGRESLATFAFANTRLDAITELSYTAYQNKVTNPTTPSDITIALQFDVDFNLSDANNAFQGRLVFEPSANGIPVTPNQYQTFNTLDPTTGRFFATNQTASGGNCTQANPCTKAQLLAFFPNVGIRNSQFGGLLLRAGGPVTGGFDGNADALVIAVNGNRTTFDFEPSSTTVVVTPTNMQGFVFFQEDPNGSGMIVAGPVTPPLGVGSAQLTVDSNGRELLLTQQFAGTRLDAITQLQYSAYQVNPANPQVTLTLQFDVDFNLNDADTSFQGRVVYEPSVNGITPQQGMFETFDATNGKFFFSRTPPGAATNPCTQAAPCTRAQVLAAFPNAGIRFVAAGAPNNGILAIKAGGPVAGGFTGNVDALVVGINNVNTVFDFEPLGATAATVNVGGRVTNSGGRGIFRAKVRMTDGTGTVRSAYTNILGYYHFAEVEVGQTLIFNLKHRGYNFTEPTKVLSLNEETVTVNFTAY